MRKISRRDHPFLLVVVLLLLLIAAHPSYGQTSQGALAGTVTDPSGAVIANANIVVTEKDTGFESQTVSTSSGSYRASDRTLRRCGQRSRL
jgi:hypothetical protein